MPRFRPLLRGWATVLSCALLPALGGCDLLGESFGRSFSGDSAPTGSPEMVRAKFAAMLTGPKNRELVDERILTVAEILGDLRSDQVDHGLSEKVAVLSYAWVQKVWGPQYESCLPSIVSSSPVCFTPDRTVILVALRNAVVLYSTKAKSDIPESLTLSGRPNLYPIRTRLEPFFLKRGEPFKLDGLTSLASDTAELRAVELDAKEQFAPDRDLPASVVVANSQIRDGKFGFEGKVQNEYREGDKAASTADWERFYFFVRVGTDS